MLCDNCQSIFTGEQELSHCDETPNIWADLPNTEYKHYSTLNDLRASAEAGCHLCLLTYDSIDVFPWGSFEDLGRQICTQGITYKIEVPQDPESPYRYLLGIGCNLFEQYFYLFPTFRERTDIGSKKEMLACDVHTTSSEKSWNIAIDWNERCKASHPDCSPKYKGWWLPTRLLDVGNGSGDTQVRLCCTDHLPPGVKYTSLSHCWGKKPCIRLTSETLCAFEKDIPVSELSNTFRDAVTITRRLGVKYLWIDSLCIIQDSLLDWQRESAKMRSVYSNSFLNIAATGSADGEGGCFKNSNPLLVRPCKIDAIWTGSHKPLSGAYECVPASIWNQYIEDSPLCKRAWVLQERFLAPRTLHFGATQLFWECRQMQAAEIYPHGFTLYKAVLKCLDPLRAGFSLRTNQLERYRLKDYASHSESQMAHTLLCLYSLWDEVVICYTHAQLTVSSDKLIALSGIAKEVQTMIGDEYKAGLWRRHMVHQLLWRVAGESLAPPAYRAPSWSWASVDGKVLQACLIPRGDGKDLLAEIHDVQIVSTTADTSGQVSQGTIRIVGALYRVSLRFHNRRMPSSEPGNPSDPYHDVTVVFDGWHSNNYFAFCRRDFPRDRELGQDLHCLPLRFVPGAAYGLGGIGRIQGLVLQPTKKKQGQFQRFGIFSIFPSRGSLITEVFATLGARQLHSEHEVEYEGEIEEREAAGLEVPNPTITNPNEICVWLGKKYIVSIV